MRKTILSFLFIVLSFLQVVAQDVKEIIQWNVERVKTGDNTYDIIATATIKKDWYLYAADPGGDGTLIPAELLVQPSNTVGLIGKPTTEDKFKTKRIEELDFSVNIHFDKLTYKQAIEVTGNTTVEVILYYMTCNAIDGKCLVPTEDTFKIEINDVNGTYTLLQSQDANNNNGVESNNVASSSENAVSHLEENDDNNLAKSSLAEIFVMGLFAGFIAFIMPCIYAMLPITVSFFTKRSTTRAAGIKNAIIYSTSIMLIFVLIGALISVLFTETTMYEVSSNIYFNLFIFVLFVIFGLSLLGAFEITLPSSLTNKLNSKANTNSVGGIFFMALVLVVVSFSCTSAFIGNLIVYIFQSGNQLGGIVGFLGFGLALALPFSLFALFPSLMNNVAKSGGWLNAVKVTMGFIELAMAMKFLSNVDLQYHWGLLNYDVYLSIWIVLFGALTLYLFGALKFAHDSDLPQNDFGKPYLTVSRLMFAIVFGAFTIYLIPGLWGAPLNLVSGFLPERKTLAFNIHDDLTKIQTYTYKASDNEVKPQKYTHVLKSEFPGIETFFDYEEALAAGKAMNKPVFVDFTGHSCVNCRQMERNVISKPEILRMLQDEFVVVSLYCDDKTKLPENEWKQSAKYPDKILKTLGSLNLDLQLTKFDNVSQPLYVVVDGEGNQITKPIGVADYDIFKKNLQEAVFVFKNK
jgi:thiol:disulfide interchange protein